MIDVKWHCFQGQYFGSVGEDKLFRLWDNRVGQSNAVQKIHAHDEDINSLSFSPFTEYIFLTASNDQTVKLFDVRNLKESLHTFRRHNDQVLEVSWSPHYETVFASSGRDKRIYFWDLSKIEEKHSATHEMPIDCIFVHGGHMDIIDDFDWNTSETFFLSSVSKDNMLHIYKPIYKPSYDDTNEQNPES